MFATVVGEDGSIKTWGNNDLENLIRLALVEMPIGGYSYRVVSRKLILRIEILTLDPFVLTLTNLEKRRHSGVIKWVLEKLDAFRESDNDTVIE